METREIELIKSSITNGRIYFSSEDIKFFPANSFGDRAGNGHRGKPVVFMASGLRIESDIRISSGKRLSPRSTFAPFIKIVSAKAGDRLVITRVSEREYSVQHVSSA